MSKHKVPIAKEIPPRKKGERPGYIRVGLPNSIAGTIHNLKGKSK
jgi:hypothetical protein